MRVYDAIVVGAGPAGGTAAFWLTEAGKDVLVLEKERLPRYKACGGGVPQAVFERFPFSFEPVIERQVERLRFRYRDGREVQTSLPPGQVAMVMRSRLDLHILQHAQADVREQTTVRRVRQTSEGVEVGTRKGERFFARYLVGADGANSWVARETGLRRQRDAGIALEVEAPLSDDRLKQYAQTALFVFGTPHQGYLWVFPKADHLSIGIGALRSHAPELQDVLKREMDKVGIDIEGAPLRGHPLPIYLRHETLQRGRVLLAGDAAGLMDPLLGEGIRYAVKSGQLAAQAILSGDLSGYSCRIHREIGDDLLWGLRWAHAFYKHPRGSFELGVRNPWFVEEFLRLFSGHSSYRRMALHALPKVLLGIGRLTPASAPADASQEPF